MDGREQLAPDAAGAGVVGGAPVDSAPLETVRQRRAGLRRAMLDLEQAAGGAAAGREIAWLGDVHDRLDEVSARFDSHIEGTEGEDGLYAEVLAASPRLANQVTRLRAGHDEICAAISAVRVQVDEISGAGGAEAVERLVDTRESINQLINRLVRHRQQGADLVFQAYAMDIGGET